MKSKEEHYGETVTVSVEIERMRKDNCLCLQCLNIKGCPYAKKFYDVCKVGGIALAVTRCREFEEHI